MRHTAVDGVWMKEKKAMLWSTIGQYIRLNMKRIFSKDIMIYCMEGGRVVQKTQARDLLTTYRRDKFAAQVGEDCFSGVMFGVDRLV